VKFKKVEMCSEWIILAFFRLCW